MVCDGRESDLEGHKKPRECGPGDLSGDPWQCSIAITSADDSSSIGTVRPVRAGDEALLTAFGREGLSADSRQKFECYNWMSDTLTSELQAAIALSLERRDLHLVALDHNEMAIGYVFLWAASDNIPELGLAVADSWHGRRVGLALLRLMEQIGRSLGKPALELTTMQDNQRALAVYKGAGWEHLGMIHNPLGCDVKQAFEGKAKPSGIAVENHCVLILDDTQRDATLGQLGEKRQRATSLFPVPDGSLDERGVWRPPA